MRKYFYPLLLLALFAAQFFFISPRGEFALNDDWVHAEMITHWIDTGVFRFNPYTGPLLYIPILYGAALVKVFGFSFTLLRVSTLIFTLALNLLVYTMTNRLTKKPALSFLLALTIWLSPIPYLLSFTFMTDIPAIVLLLAAVASYYFAFTTKKIHWLWLGGICALLGFFTRQTVGLVLGAAAIYLLWQHYRGRALFSLRTWLPAVLIPITLAVLIYWQLGTYGLLPGGLESHRIIGWLWLVKHILWWIWYAFIYTGLAGLPLAAACLLNRTLWKDRRWWWFAGISIGIAALLRIFFHAQLPYILNTITIFGLGPMREVLNGQLQPLFPGIFWIGLTGAAAVSAATLAYTFLTKKITAPTHTNWFLLVVGLSLAPILVVESFDRYFVPVSILILLALAPRLHFSKIQFAGAAITLALIGAYSITQTDFYLRWNAARWQLADAALQKTNGIAEHIDGGYEWDGWHTYWSARASNLPHGHWVAPWWIRKLFANNTEDYIVSFSPLANYEIVSSTKITGPNPNDTVFLLKQKNTNK